MNLNKRVVPLIACVAAIVLLTGCMADTTSAQPEDVSLPATAEAPSATPSEEAPATEPAPAPEQETEPEPAPPVQPSYDELAAWTASQDPNDQAHIGETLEYLGSRVGVTGLVVPAHEYVELGWWGVAPLGDFCVIAVGADGGSIVGKEMTLQILPRYEAGEPIPAPWTADDTVLQGVVATYTDWCNGGPLPDLSGGSAA